MLTQKLEELGLNEERRADLISKYILADKKLEFQMNDYFKIYKVSKVKPNRRESINQPKLAKEVAGVYKPTITRTKPEYLGGYSRNFDNRGRPSFDPNYDNDQNLDKEFFNS